MGRGYRRSGAGSSPHARGLPRSQSSCLILSGIIPACAGFTTPREDVTGIMRDHPRMRGVYGITRRGERPAEGSSPHARGLRPARIVTADTYRIIPACAGFTDRLPARQVQDTDHPRMRGVYAEAFALPVIEGGSSPHARGLLVTPAEQESRGGIIPACAGFTAWWCGRVRPGWDHPRMRGVYRRVGSGPRPRLGSSPHARGLPARPATSRPQGRIIPACAGFTRRPRRSRWRGRDHPRMRGVYVFQRPTLVQMSGSSPHARGLPCPGVLVDRAQGIIPACAGFTRRKP